MRVIASTNADLDAMVKRGEFRADLLFRLSVLTLPLPPLRSRAGDPRLLAQLLRPALQRAVSASAATARPCRAARISIGTTGRATSASSRISFTARCCCPMAPRSRSSPPVSISLRKTRRSLDQPFQEAKAAAIARFERDYVTELLRRTGGNISLASRLCGKERSRLTKLVKKYGLERLTFTRS